MGSRLPLLIDFLDIMCEKLVLPSLAERVRTLRNSYNTATMMYNKFQRLWMEALDLPTNQLVMDFAWSLFIYLKGVWAPRCVDCGACFTGSDLLLVVCDDACDAAEFKPRELVDVLKLLLGCMYFVVANATTLPHHVFAYTAPDAADGHGYLTVAEFVAKAHVDVDAADVSVEVRRVTKAVRQLSEARTLQGIFHDPVKVSLAPRRSLPRHKRSSRGTAPAAEQAPAGRGDHAAASSGAVGAGSAGAPGGKDASDPGARLRASSLLTGGDDMDGTSALLALADVSSSAPMSSPVPSPVPAELPVPEEATFLAHPLVTRNTASLHGQYAKMRIRAITELDERMFLNTKPRNMVRWVVGNARGRLAGWLVVVAVLLTVWLCGCVAVCVWLCARRSELPPSFSQPRTAAARFPA